MPAPAELAPGSVPAPEDTGRALLDLIGSPDLCSRRWVWEQYDHMVMADTVIRPGSDAAVVRVHGTAKALAFTSDVTPRYCKANPVEGGKQAVVEAYRNLSATGAKPLASTDNLNFGNPERPVIMGQLVGCIEGIGAACLALDMPIVSGNVSLYNETSGEAILPTPTIGAVGLLSSLDQMISMAPEAGDTLVLIGETVGHLGQSAWLWELHGRAEGDAPPVDLEAERRAGDLVRALKARGLITAAHDLSDGGLAVAAAEMALAAGVGVTVEADGALAPSAWFFGEDQGRYLLGCKDADAVIAAAAVAGVSAHHVGEMGGDAVRLGASGIALADLHTAHRGGFARMMGEIS
jgi:phosphoribosylformylglycinamidine (FGAM) synthase-like enzyme